MRPQEVMRFENSSDSTDGKMRFGPLPSCWTPASLAESDDTSPTHEVDVRSHPTTMMQLSEMVGSFMITSNKDREHWSDLLARIILVERVHRSILLWH